MFGFGFPFHMQTMGGFGQGMPTGNFPQQVMPFQMPQPQPQQGPPMPRPPMGGGQFGGFGGFNYQSSPARMGWMSPWGGSFTRPPIDPGILQRLGRMKADQPTDTQYRAPSFPPMLTGPGQYMGNPPVAQQGYTPQRNPFAMLQGPGAYL